MDEGSAALSCLPALLINPKGGNGNQADNGTVLPGNGAADPVSGR